MSLYSLLLRAATPLARRAPIPPLAVTRLDIPVDGLGPELDGFCIAQISDLHIGEGSWGPEHAREAARVIAEARPDVVVNTGDFLEEEPPLDRVDDVVGIFQGGGHEGEPRHLAVLGNHDYFPPEEMTAELKEHLNSIGVELLLNRGVCVRRGVRGISFIGLTAEEPGFNEGLSVLEQAGRPRVVLIHEPDLAERIPSGSADLILAGHTHGGQISVPPLEGIIVRLFCGSRYTEGLMEINGNRVYVNRGLGCVGMPMRFGAAPEVTLIHLVR